MTNILLHVLKYLDRTSLHLASYHGHQTVVELLLDRGANIDQKNNNGEFIYLFVYVFIVQLICLFNNLNLDKI